VFTKCSKSPQRLYIESFLQKKQVTFSAACVTLSLSLFSLHEPVHSRESTHVGFLDLSGCLPLCMPGCCALVRFSGLFVKNHIRSLWSLRNFILQGGTETNKKKKADIEPIFLTKSELIQSTKMQDILKICIRTLNPVERI
jgi:hypothetical protein